MRKLLRRLTTAMACGLGWLSNRRQTAVAWGLLVLLGLGRPCRAEVFPYLSIETDVQPSFRFYEYSTGQSWYVAGSGDYGFSISSWNFEQNTMSRPFQIETGAPWHSIQVADDGRVGFGTATPEADLHVASKQYSPKANLRLEVPADNYGFPRTAWDLSVSGGYYGDLLTRFSLSEPDSDTTPLTVESHTPTDTLYLANTGSVGLGTSSPNMIGNTSTGGRYLNVRDNVGPARVVVQGGVAGELNLVHNNAPANQRNLRIRSSGGTASFNVVNDAVTGFTVANAIAINMSNGNIGLKVANPTNPLELASGAKCTKGGVWTNASSRELKQDIQPLTIEQARETVRALQPVGYRYKNEPKEHYCGFIAEDVPELVATSDRKSLAAMDIVSVLTRVVQDQDRQLDEARQRNTRQQVTLDEQRTSLAQQQELLVSLNKRLTNLEQQSRDSGDQCRGTLVRHGR